MRTLEQIKTERQRMLDKVNRRTDRECKKVLIAMFQELPEPLRVKRVIFGSGGYSVDPKEKHLTFVPPDTPYDMIDSEGETIVYCELFHGYAAQIPDEWVLVGMGTPLTASDIYLLVDAITDALVWWVDTTGGSDLVFEE